MRKTITEILTGCGGYCEGRGADGQKSYHCNDMPKSGSEEKAHLPQQDETQ